MTTDDEDQCAPWNTACMGMENAESLLGEAFSNQLEDIAKAITEAVGQAVAAMATGWLRFNTPDLITSGQSDGGTVEARQPPEVETVETLLGWVAWISLGVCVLSLMAAGAMIALRARRGEGGEHLSKVAVILAASVLIGAASAIARPLVASGPSARAAEPVQVVQEHVWWYVGAAVVLSVIVGAAKMAWEQRADPGRDLIQSLLTLVVVTGCGLSVLTIAVRASDNFARWLILSDKEEFGERVLDMLALSSNSGGVQFSVLLVICLGSMAMLLSLIQIVLLLFRDGMLVLLAAVLPLMASFTNTEMGKAWLKKTVAWIIAFLLYKPAAAIVYSVAFAVIAVDESDTNSPTLVTVLIGLALMAMALVALPALMKFVVPMASLSGGGAAAGAMAGVAGAVGGQVASGAIDKFKGTGESEAGAGGGQGGADPSGATTPGQQSGSHGNGHDRGGRQDAEGSATTQNQNNPSADDASAATDPAQGGSQTQAAQPTGSEAAGSQAGSAASGAATAGVAEGARMAKETGEAVHAGAKGTMEEAAEGPDGS